MPDGCRNRSGLLRDPSFGGLGFVFCVDTRRCGAERYAKCFARRSPRRFERDQRSSDRAMFVKCLGHKFAYSPQTRGGLCCLKVYKMIPRFLHRGRFGDCLPFLAQVREVFVPKPTPNSAVLGPEGEEPRGRR